MTHLTHPMTAWSKFQQIKYALDQADIEGLLAVECPSDEYDGEASLIESGIAKATNFGKNKVGAHAVEAVVSEVWNSQFGPFGPEDLKKRRPAFASVAQKIVEAL